MELNYDVVVIGAGHAGCEAATAAANLGARVCMVTMDMNKVAPPWVASPKDKSSAKSTPWADTWDW